MAGTLDAALQIGTDGDAVSSMRCGKSGPEQSVFPQQFSCPVEKCNKMFLGFKRLQEHVAMAHADTTAGKEAVRFLRQRLQSAFSVGAKETGETACSAASEHGEETPKVASKHASREMHEVPAHETVEVVVETEEEAEERTKRTKRLHARTQQTPVDRVVAAAVCSGEAIERREKTERKEVLKAVKKKGELRHAGDLSTKSTVLFHNKAAMTCFAANLGWVGKSVHCLVTVLWGLHAIPNRA
jgi:hypothetical protein